ncbi:MAG: hypothetical protein LC793_12530, partial [Thermomicrobia bacterium]|nr:hypothetical protein [Thermomicrobia bacterium]MCA1725623.1 hypothetical protein [Thermomicrobia bacterium]
RRAHARKEMSMLRWQRLLLIAALPFILASCTAGSNDRAGGQASAVFLPTPIPTDTLAVWSSRAPVAVAAVPPASCPITHPAQPPFIPPSPYPPTPPPPYANQFWSGTAMLWTMLGTDGTWGRLPYANGSYTQKILWWRQGYDWQTEPEPQLTVTGRRLNAPAPPLAATRASNGFRDDIGSFGVVGVDIPTQGCWEITGQAASTELRFVVWLAP